MSGQVKFIYMAFYKIQIVLKQIHSNKQENNNRVKGC